jgi:phosphorylase kinase alpha/beta subunit
MFDVRNRELLPYIKPRYTIKDVRAIRSLLEQRGTFSFAALSNGLFPAASSSGGDVAVSGYHHVWVRDNVYVAYAHYVNGKVSQATQTMQALAGFFSKHVNRFEDIIAGRADPGDPMQRPHVRFDGDRLAEVEQRWPHAQNDAIGYFLWFYCTLACQGHLRASPEDMRLLERATAYLKAIRYWADEDSGHWEEARKVEASSIGVVVGGLQALRALYGIHRTDTAIPDELISRGRHALHGILPNECIQDDPRKRREYDAALLFLIFPVKVVDGPLADRILDNVITHLQGDHGIRRYRGDSYWCADYKKHLGRQERTQDFSERMESRDVLLREGEEAQWCIFDPIISAIYGDRYGRTALAGALARQTMYFNRALSQLTAADSEFGALQCPEAYYLQDGRYVPNDHTPLLWTQANLWVALKLLEDSLLRQEQYA